MLSIMGEPKSMGMRSIATYNTFARFQENTTIFSYIYVQYTIKYTISEKRIAQYA